MKKLLIATTALVTSAGIASADVSLGGDGNLGVDYAGGRTTKKTRLQYEIDLTVLGSGTTDGGLTFGGSVDLDAQSDAAGQAASSEVKDVELFVSGQFGTLTVGDLDPSADDIGMKDVGFDGIGADDVWDNIAVIGTDSVQGQWKATANARYDITVGGFTFIATADTFDEDYGAAFIYDFGAWNIAAAFVRDAGGTEAATATVIVDPVTGLPTVSTTPAITVGKNDSTSARIGYAAGAFDVNLYWTRHQNQTDATLGATEALIAATDGMSVWGVDFEYTTGAYTITLAGNQSDLKIGGAKDNFDWGIGLAYDLGGGAALVGGVGQSDGLSVVGVPLFVQNGVTKTTRETVADFGVTLKF